MSKTYLSFPYIINFCNLTQVRTTTGFVRNIRRIKQAPYPLIKVQPDEIIMIAGMSNLGIHKTILQRDDNDDDDDVAGRWLNDGLIPVPGRQQSGPVDSKKYGTNKKSSKKSKQSGDNSQSNTIARTIFHIFGKLSCHSNLPVKFSECE